MNMTEERATDPSLTLDGPSRDSPGGGSGKDMTEEGATDPSLTKPLAPPGGRWLKETDRPGVTYR
jgi:hypothetical protein